MLILLCSEAAGPTFDEVMLRQLFGLTPAEARLALGLAAARSLAAIGAEHRVTENTLRTQLAGILRKTDAANQRELVRILNLPPAMAVGTLLSAAPQNNAAVAIIESAAKMRTPIRAPVFRISGMATRDVTTKFV